MRKVFCFLGFLVFALTISAQQLYVASYNIRNDNQGDVREGNGWAQRCSVICSMINDQL